MAEGDRVTACTCAPMIRSDDPPGGPEEDCPEHGNPQILGYAPLKQYELLRDENERLRRERDRAEQRLRLADDAHQENLRLRAANQQIMQDSAVIAEKSVDAQEENSHLRARVDRVRALHERIEGDSGNVYCDVCSNHGDISWPCATIAALDAVTV